MVLGFWSNVKGQTGNTANMLAISTVLAIEGIKCCVLETAFANNNLQFNICGDQAVKSDTMFDDTGIDNLLRLIKSSQTDPEGLEACTISLLNKKLNYIPRTSKTNGELFTKEFFENIKPTLAELDRLYDVILIDIEAGLGDSYDEKYISPFVMELCDYIIVSSSQNLNVINTLFKTYQLPWDKVIFVVGMYDQTSVIKEKYLIKKYTPYITKSNLYVIPYDTGFRDALFSAEVVKYISKNRGAKKTKDNTKYFIDSVYKVALAIYNLIN